jgi:predicted DNA-binding antitoxin AbrB/MazE fold protein
MAIEVDAVYENGLLKPDHVLPLAERQRVRIIVQPDATVTRQSYGIIGWQGDPEAVRRVALDPEHGVAESP